MLRPARTEVLSTPIDVLTLEQAAAQIVTWAQERSSRSVCCANAHVLTTAWRRPGYAAAVRACDLIAPDGMPVVWALRLLGRGAAKRVYGPSLMVEVCRRAAAGGHAVFLYGSTGQTLQQLEHALLERVPGLRVAGTLSPPFRHRLTDEELDAHLGIIRESAASIVMVGLGAPKQEHWMRLQRGRLDAVMIGVGAAFDFHAGTVPQAPRWMQNLGLEWSFRLAIEPRRLWKRYVLGNTLFLLLATRQIAASRLGVRRWNHA